MIDVLKKLSKDDLEFYQKLISFFELLGISEEDLTNIVSLVKDYQELKSTCESNTRRIEYVESKCRPTQPYDNYGIDRNRF